jgi:hypothetical protein
MVTATIEYRSEESPGTISAMCTINMSPTTMESHFCTWKAQRSDERTKMFGAEKQHGFRSK